MVNIGRSNLTFWTVSTPAPSCRWARNNPSQRCAKRSQNSRSFLSCASAASFLHCWTWSWKKSEVSSIATTTTKAPLTGASTNQKRSNLVFVPRDQKRGSATDRPAGIRKSPGLYIYRRLQSREHSIACGIAGRVAVYLRLTIQAYGSAYGRRRPAPALPVLRLADAVAALSCQGQSGFQLSQF